MNKIVKERISPQLLKPESTLRVVENPIFDLLWLNNDRQILTACGHKFCHLIDAETNFNLFTLDHHDSAVKSLAKCDENNLVASGGRDGKIFLYDFRMRDSGAVGAFNLIGRHFFSQQILQKGGIGVSGQSSSRKPSGNLVSLSVTGLAFYGQTQLVSIESHSDKISFFDLKMLDSSDVRNVRQATSPVQNSMNQTPRKLQNFSKMFQCALENTFYQSTFGDPYKTQKGNISIVIKGNKMLVNSMDSVISLYDMYNIYQKPPQRFIGHKSMHEFYVRANFGFYDDFIVSGSEDEKVHIWDIKSHQEIAHLGCSEQNFGHIGISNEVQWCEHDKIISTSDDLSVIVWDEVYLSCGLQKYNRYGIKQQRTLLITNMHLFNLSKQKINRRIDLFKVDGFTISEDQSSSEFIIHVSGEYDYRYISQNLRDVIASTIRKILRNKGHNILYYRVASTKLKNYATVKKEVPKGIFRRPEKMYIIEDENLDNLEKKGDEDLKNKRNSSQIEEDKTQEQFSNIQETQSQQIANRKQTAIQQDIARKQTQAKQQTAVNSNPVINNSQKELPQYQAPLQQNMQQSQQQIKPKPKSQAYQAQTYKICEGNISEFVPASKQGLIVSEITDPKAFTLTNQQIDVLNSCKSIQPVSQLVEKEGAFTHLVSQEPNRQFETLEALIQKRQNELKRFKELEPLDDTKVAQIFGNLVRAISELESKQIEIWLLQPQNIYVNEQTKQVKIVVNESMFQNLRLAGDSTYSYLMPASTEIKYQAPEMIDSQCRSLTTIAWSIGLMMYELMYGYHPFINKDNKIMQILIKRYPVVFPEGTEVSQEFQEIVNDLLIKDIQQRLGSENLEREVFDHAFFKKNYER
eukprot:403366400